ncbi:hypothetical protein FO440_17695 [Mucilaginibacter corticis]|uniref:SnoaL-like domain-containing protein n=1 Tax=Mucilaginibacter corticis TaxID=2597670 RepID=A0A556MI36_9SPHI|nr:ester cyclase [Mucilaginibacter corticis]TSJ39576.1 hypothetical protein FO440_17695 [Mucilaginibacter corticis]
METKSNKAVVAQFYKEIIKERNESLIDVYVRKDYIQHSPAGKDGREGIREMICFLKTLPPSTEKTSPVKLLLADGDLVAGLLYIAFMGKQMLVLDLFRLQNGQLAEHWDVVQEVNHPEFDGFVIDLNANAVTNKDLVRARYELMEDCKVYRVIGEGDMVIVQLEYNEQDIRFARYDILRVNDEMIDQVLSVKQKISDVMMHGNGML